MSTGKEKVRFITALLAALALPVIPAILLWQSFAKFGQINDLPEYYAAAKLMLSGHGSLIYSLPDLIHVQHSFFPQLGSRGIALFIPPIALPWFAPIAWVPADIIIAVWAAGLFILLLSSIALLKKLFDLPATSTLWLWAILSAWAPAYESLRIGQIAPLMLCGLCFFLIAYKQDRLVLAALALSVLWLKPQELLPIFIFLIGARRYLFLFFILGFTAFLAFVSYIQVGAEGYSNYWKLLSDPASCAPWMQSQLCPTIRGQLLLSNLNAQITPVISFIALLAASVYIFILGRRLSEYEDWLFMGLPAVISLGLITSFHCHDYDLLLLVPPSLIILNNTVELKWKCLMMMPLAVYLLPIYIPLHYDYLLHGGNINISFICLLLFALMSACWSWRQVGAAEEA